MAAILSWGRWVNCDRYEDDAIQATWLLYGDCMTASFMTSLTKICWWKFVVTPEVVTTMSRPLVTAKFVSWQVAKFSIWTDAARVISYAVVSLLCYQDAQS